MPKNKTILDLVRPILFSVLVFYSLYFGYQFEVPYIKFIPSTLSIFIIVMLFYRKTWAEVLGLKANLKQVALALGLMILFCAVSYPVITWNLTTKGYSLLTASIFDYLIVPFQTLNEEIVFRALLLGVLLKTGLRKTTIIFLPALVFSLFHLVFYSDIVGLENRGIVSSEALITLFMFGIATNALFLKYRNIYFPWALHCGWNIHRFGSKMVPVGEMDHNHRIEEYMTFNLLEGGVPIMVLSIILAGITLCLLKRTRIR